VVSDLDDQVAAAAGGGGGGVIGAAQYQKAADVLRGYCEEHGREKIDGKASIDNRLLEGEIILAKSGYAWNCMIDPRGWAASVAGL
jgi:hypothetical protein